MKKTILLAAALFTFGALKVNAQCSPDLSIVTPGIFPDSATNLDTGTVSLFYSDTIQFKVYSTFAGFTVNWVRVVSINNLPPGFTTSSNPPGMQFPGGSNGCVLIQGTAPATPNVYWLIINLKFNVTGPLGSFDVDTLTDDYRIVIDAQSGIPVYQPVVFDVLQNYPNPFYAQTEISFTAPSAAKADFRVYDMLGREIITRNIDAVPGTNKITLFSKYLKPGIYFYKLNYKNKSITRKMIVTAKP